MDSEKLIKLATFVRYCILKSTEQADSGHPTSSLSAVELMTALFFGGILRYAPENPEHPNNDRVVFSKGHASPLFYSLWAAADQLTEDDLLTYRSFGSNLEGHPTVSFPHTEAATGSLGQGLAVGLGLALNGKYLDKLPYKTFVLLGDSEMTEGSQWESIAIAAHYNLDNLVGVLDVNGLGQRGETMYGHNLSVYDQRLQAFGWETIVVEDGHSLPAVLDAYRQADEVSDQPVMIIANTVKGKGVPSVEGKNGYHGKAVGKEAMEEALDLWGDSLDRSIRGHIARPEDLNPEQKSPGSVDDFNFSPGDKAATRDAYGTGLNRIFPKYPDLVALDGEVSNSTRAKDFLEKHPDRFFEMYVAEQNMVGAALGLSRRGKIPFVSTFAAFLTRAFDQIRMSQYSGANIKFMGSHAGVSIGKDGPSQMGLEDLAMFRTIRDAVIFYPGDAMAMEKLIEVSAAHSGIVYIRGARPKNEVIYAADEEFRIGGSKVLRSSDDDAVTVLSAGCTLFEALDAFDTLRTEGIPVRVIDLYSIKPLDCTVVQAAAKETGAILVVEDHYAEGGIGDAVFSALRGVACRTGHLAVTKQPRSGDADSQLEHQQISSAAIVQRVKAILS